eukprot:scaffold328272_cov25-Prasinocladus_malaysianus.AAC.1
MMRLGKARWPCRPSHHRHPCQGGRASLAAATFKLPDMLPDYGDGFLEAALEVKRTEAYVYHAGLTRLKKFVIIIRGHQLWPSTRKRENMNPTFTSPMI